MLTMRPAALRLHRRQHRLRAEEGAVQVDLDHAPPRVRRQRLARRVEVARGVVHEHVDAPALVHDLLDHGPHALGVAHVDRHGRRPRA
jgi:hypothetical protein